MMEQPSSLDGTATVDGGTMSGTFDQPPFPPGGIDSSVRAVWRITMDILDLDLPWKL